MPIARDHPADADLAPAADHELVEVDDWAIDELAARRLRHQLEAAGRDVVAVAAGPGLLEPGESLLTRTAHQALQPLDAVREHGPGTIAGAAVLRAGVGYAVGEGIDIDAGGGTILVDPGAYVHDGWQPIAEVGEATAASRTSLRRAPVVLFIGETTDHDVADWTRILANGLVRRGVDARLALPAPAEGLHLSRPCLPGEHAVRTIRPDVVVPLDRWAADRVEGWLEGDRSALVIETTPDVTLGVELVSWRLGHDSGRVRARLGSSARARDVAAVVDRLCAGPQPLPPLERDGNAPTPVAVQVASPTHRRADRSRHVVVHDPAGTPTLAALAIHLRDAGCAVDTTVTTGPADQRADVLVIGPDPFRDEPIADDVAPVLDARRRDGRPTVVVLSAEAFATDGEGRLDIAPLGSSLARRATHLVAPSAPLADLLAIRGHRALVLPTLITPARYQELTEQQATDPGADVPPAGDAEPTEPLPTAAGPLVVWHVDAEADSSEAKAVLEALRRLVTDDPRVRVALSGSGAAGIDGEHGWQWGSATEPPNGGGGPADVPAVQVWTPRDTDLRTGDDLVLVEAGLRGVPTLLAHGHPATSPLAHPRALTVAPEESVDAWFDALRHLLDDPGARARRSREVRHRAETLRGPAASRVVAERFLAWVEGGGAA